MKTIKNVLLVAFFMLGVTVFAQQNVGPTQYRPDFLLKKNHNKSKGLNNKQGQKTQTIPMQQY